MTTNNKLLFIAPSAYHLGGVQTWLDYLLPGLDAKHFNSTIALPNDHDNSAIKYLDIHPFNSVRYLETSTGTIRERVNAIEQLIKSVDPAIIVVVNIYDAYSAINNLRKRGLSSARIVTTIHGIQEDLLTGIKVNSNIIDAVISTNRLTQKLVSQHTGIDADRIFYAPYGVTELATDISKKQGAYTVAYVGRIEEQQKCINDLLAIFSRLLREVEDLTILIAGDGPDLSTLEQWLQKEEKYNTQINYLGVIDPAKVADEIYGNADTLLLTSRWETGPIVAWEAMRSNVTLVSSRYTGSLEEASLVDGENCLMFDVGDIDGAVDKIKQSCDPTLRDKLNSNALSLVQTKYSINNSIDTWAQCFNEICATNAKQYTHNTFEIKDKGTITSLFNKLFGDRGEHFAEQLRKLFVSITGNHSKNTRWPHSYHSSEIELINLDKYLKDRDQ